MFSNYVKLREGTSSVFKTDEHTSLNFRSHLRDFRDCLHLLDAAYGQWAMSFAHHLRYECLRSSGASGQHIANQWFDLSKSNVWRVNVRSFRALFANWTLSNPFSRQDGVAFGNRHLMPRYATHIHAPNGRHGKTHRLSDHGRMTVAIRCLTLNIT